MSTSAVVSGGATVISLSLSSLTPSIQISSSCRRRKTTRERCGVGLSEKLVGVPIRCEKDRARVGERDRGGEV
ncbi:hypothetical protein Hanom_Chr06g00535681 [Helianthus anomalus]